MTQSTTTADTNSAWRSVLSKDEVDGLLELHDLHSWGSIALNWAIVFASMALVALLPHLLTLLLALCVIAPRQLALACLLHETPLPTPFRYPQLADRVGNGLRLHPI